MSIGRLDPPLVPRDGRTLRLLIPVRVSDLTKQDERSLDDQRAKMEAWIRENTDYPFELDVLEGSGSGECLEREQYLQLIEKVDSGSYDGVISEDLGRIVRRIHAHLFCERCVDRDTRLIALNDHVDTARDGWQDSSIFSAWHHERSNRDTSDRIKRTHRNRFMGGGCLRHAVYGWVKPPGAKNDSQLGKDPNAEPIYREWFRLLDEDDANFADVARMLNARAVPVTRWKGGAAAWDGKMVARHTFNPLLKGVRERNRRKSKRVNSTGRYRSIKAEPMELLVRNVPHLAFFDAAYFDRVVAKVRARNAVYRRTADPAADPCRNRPRKHTRYPGRISVCGVCGRPFVWGGHGRTDHLMCSGARLHRCWNGSTFDGPLAAGRIAAAVVDRVRQLPDFDLAFGQVLAEEHRSLSAGRDVALAELRGQLAGVERGIANLIAFARDGKHSAGLREELERLEDQKVRFSAELSRIEALPCQMVRLPPAGEIQSLVYEALEGLAIGSTEFGAVMRKLVPQVVLFPYRLLDSPAMVLRARLRLHLTALLPERQTARVLQRPMEQILWVDLFDPPQREAFRARVVAGRTAGRTEQQIAAECGITVTAAQRAATLQRKMSELGTVDAYEPVLAAPQDGGRIRRHRHGDYRFEPLPGTGDL